jgi:hypothetical protein
MGTKKLPHSSTAALVAGLCLAASAARLSAQQAAGTVRIDHDDLGGVVTSAKGPEAGV